VSLPRIAKEEGKRALRAALSPGATPDKPAAKQVKAADSGDEQQAGTPATMEEFLVMHCGFDPAEPAPLEHALKAVQGRMLQLRHFRDATGSPDQLREQISPRWPRTT
jgi:hypothetical protein